MQAIILADLYGIPPATVATMVAMAAILYSAIRWRKNMIRKQNKPPEPDFKSKAAPMSMRVVNAEVEALLGEVEETSRRLTAQLDNRYTRLEQLVAEADEKIRRLEQLTQTAAETSAPPAAVSEGQRALSRLRHERGAPAASDDPAYQPIYTLADRGKSPREIAQELGRQPGEIELILALRQR